jgi:hypothetical protein
MAGLHDRILKTLKDAGTMGLTVEELQQRLHPVFPPAIDGGVKRLASQGLVLELAKGRYAVPDAEGGPGAGRPRQAAAATKARTVLRPKPGERRGGPPDRAEEPRRQGKQRPEREGPAKVTRPNREGEGARSPRATVQGRLVKHRDGFGFVTPEDP